MSMKLFATGPSVNCWTQSWQYLGAKLEANKLPPLAAQMSQECHSVLFDTRIQRIIYLKAENDQSAHICQVFSQVTQCP